MGLLISALLFNCMLIGKVTLFGERFKCAYDLGEALAASKEFSREKAVTRQSRFTLTCFLLICFDYQNTLRTQD
jgi:hypothetical protein